MSHRLSHGRYNDGKEYTVRYCRPPKISYRVRARLVDEEKKLNEKENPIQPNIIHDVVLDRAPDLQRLLTNRLEKLESIISMEFDGSRTHVAALYVRQRRHGNRYLNEICPTYTYVTTEEFHQAGCAFRGRNNQVVTMMMPLFLTWEHAMSSRGFMQSEFTRIANITQRSDGTCRWHDLWVPDILAHLINQAIVDIAKSRVIEPSVQFVLDALRLLIFCCHAPDFRGRVVTKPFPWTETKQLMKTFVAPWALPQPYPGAGLMFPQMLPLMKKFVHCFIYHPSERTRDKVPDLGDLLQWLAVLELFGGSFTWKDLVHSIVVESTRRHARWFCKALQKERGLTPRVTRIRTNDYEWRFNSHGKRFKYWKYRSQRESSVDMMKRFIREEMTAKELVAEWWESAQVGYRAILFSYAFYTKIVQGRTLPQFCQKYDLVLGSVYDSDLLFIREAEREIRKCQSLSESFQMMEYPLQEQEIYDLLLWAVEAQDGYHKADPLEGGWKEGRRSSCRQPIRATTEASKDVHNGRPSANPFSVLDDENSFHQK